MVFEEKTICRETMHPASPQYAFCFAKSWGLSSAGRAPALQAGGHRFDPDRLHQKSFREAKASKASQTAQRCAANGVLTPLRACAKLAKQLDEPSG